MQIEITDIKFRKGDFVIARGETEDGNVLGVKGYAPGLDIGRIYDFDGEPEMTKYGPTISFTVANEVMPETKSGILDYLGSGYVKGIGFSLAKRIVDEFGEKTFDVFREHPEDLLRISGIGPKKLEKIMVSWEEQRSIQKIMTFLSGCGFTYVMASRVFKAMGAVAETKIRNDPYCLANEVDGIGFLKADAVAASLGITGTDPRRLSAGIIYSLQKSGEDGNVFEETGVLIKKAGELLFPENSNDRNIESDLHETLRHMILDGDVVESDGKIYHKDLWSAEIDSALYLQRLMNGTPACVNVEKKTIGKLEQLFGIRYDDSQKNVIAGAAASPVSVITGGPGTGKTTIVRSLIDIFEKRGLSVLLAAPTGRAAKRMSEATGRPASTIHRMLGYTPCGFTYWRGDPLCADVVIVDEASMIDIRLFRALITAMPEDSRIILVGDVDQLPPVGPGNVLRDIISSGTIPVFHLSVIHRQAADSTIIKNASLINRGIIPDLSGASDFEYIEIDRSGDLAADTANCIVNRFVSELKSGDLSIMDVQVLAPMKKGDAGTLALNARLQSILTGSNNSFAFHVGDKVMQMKNDYDRDVYNGDVGIIGAVNEQESTVIVDFDGHYVEYDRVALSDLSLAYACTVHKSQGSEYRIAIISLIDSYFVMLKRNLLYTAITRAKQKVVLIGTKRAIAMATKNNSIVKRNTTLAMKLNEKRAGLSEEEFDARMFSSCRDEDE